MCAGELFAVGARPIVLGSLFLPGEAGGHLAAGAGLLDATGG
ncbi:hypothetical protein OZK63_38890 [Streptomyces sp. UMAF16]|nr:hypothetical protein [Streptomyces sp. UMAF16]